MTTEKPESECALSIARIFALMQFNPTSGEILRALANVWQEGHRSGFNDGCTVGSNATVVLIEEVSRSMMDARKDAT